MSDVKEKFMQFVLQKVKENTSNSKPYYFPKWSGLPEMARELGLDFLEIVDEMHERKMIRKAIFKTRSGKRILALSLPNLTISKKVRALLEEFENFKNE